MASETRNFLVLLCLAFASCATERAARAQEQSVPGYVLPAGDAAGLAAMRKCEPSKEDGSIWSTVPLRVAVASLQGLMMFMGGNIFAVGLLQKGQGLTSVVSGSGAMAGAFALSSDEGLGSSAKEMAADYCEQAVAASTNQ